jgi:hypothetical protein
MSSSRVSFGDSPIFVQYGIVATTALAKLKAVEIKCGKEHTEFIVTLNAALVGQVTDTPCELSVVLAKYVTNCRIPAFSFGR